MLLYNGQNVCVRLGGQGWGAGGLLANREPGARDTGLGTGASPVMGLLWAIGGQGALAGLGQGWAHFLCGNSTAM